VSNNVNGQGPNFGPSYEKAYAGQAISIDHVNKASEAGRKNAITTIVGDGQIARGPSGTSIVLPRPRRENNSWLVNRVGKQIRVLLGNIYNGKSKKHAEKDLARITNKVSSNQVYFQYTTCSVAGAAYDNYNQVWTFPKTDVTTDMIIWLDLTLNESGEAELKYTDDTAYAAAALLKQTVVIATLIGNETVLQATYGDVWIAPPPTAKYHPFEVVRITNSAGLTETFIYRGSVFSYPSGDNGFVDTVGNAPQWRTGGYMQHGLTKITAPSSSFQVFLEFKREVDLKNPVDPEDPHEYTDWAYARQPPDLPEPNAPEVSSRWICRLCLGDIGSNLLYGNYNINLAAPPDPSNYKELKSEDIDVNGTLSSWIGDIPVRLSQKKKTYGIKFFSYGAQYYLIASIQTGATWTIVQNLASDFFFYPPLDNRHVFWDSQVNAVSSDTGLPPNPSPPEE
jgi:hypothetical protein